MEKDRCGVAEQWMHRQRADAWAGQSMQEQHACCRKQLAPCRRHKDGAGVAVLTAGAEEVPQHRRWCLTGGCQSRLATTGAPALQGRQEGLS